MNKNMNLRTLFAGLMIVVLAALPGSAVARLGDPVAPMNTKEAAAPAPTPSDNKDPLEALNRGIFKINEVLDGLILKPIAHIYRGVLPQPVQNGVKNVLSNLAAPVVFLNSALQGDKDNTGRTFGRFLVNSTLGVAGVFDIASDMGLKKERDKDFGQTMGVWGVHTGPYIYLPIVGPSDTRDSLGLIVDFVSDPFTWILTSEESWIRYGVDVAVKRADYLPLTDRVYRDSLDPYATFRSIYLQHRRKVVRDYLSRDTGELEKEDGKQ